MQRAGGDERAGVVGDEEADVARGAEGGQVLIASVEEIIVAACTSAVFARRPGLRDDGSGEGARQTAAFAASRAW